MNPVIAAVLQALAFGLAQVLLFRHLGLGGWAEAHVHVLFLLLLPSLWRPIPLLLIAFVYGLLLSVIDVPLGAHAVAALNVMAARGWWLTVITPGLSTSREALEFDRQDIGWYLTYLFPLIGLYELSYLPVANLEFSFTLLGRAVLSTVYTGALCLAIVILLYRRR